MSRKSKDSLDKKAAEMTDAFLRRWPLPIANAGDKDGQGVALIVAGSPGIPGAILLAADSAFRAGAGKVQIAAPKGVTSAVGLALPETLVVPFSASPKLVKMAADADVVLIGPGMLFETTLMSFIKKLIRENEKQVLVVDAAALVAFSKKNLISTEGACRMIITPHAGEMATLTGFSKIYVEEHQPEVAVKVAKQINCVVVLKGPVTYIAHPDGRLLRNDRGHRGLAKAGSGDSLAGLITGIAAAGADVFQAAAWGVALHARAAEELAQSYGGPGFLARELSGKIPNILNRLGPKS